MSEIYPKNAVQTASGRGTWDSADDGSLDVPVALVDALFAAGVSGFPNAQLVRRTVDSQLSGDGCIELEVASQRSVNVTVAP